MVNNKQKKIIGIIGGFGPEATAQFYMQLVNAGRQISHGTQPTVIVRNAPVPKKLEHALLINGDNLNGFIPLLTDAAKFLEKAGADCITLPCNTLHVHEDIIRASVHVPFISLIQSTTDFLKRQHFSRIGIVGSRVTIQENLFKKRTKNIEFINVKTHLQRNIDVGLDMFVENQKPQLLQKALNASFSFFAKNNVHDVLLACTDFHGLYPTVQDIRVHDTLEILVQETINMI